MGVPHPWPGYPRLDLARVPYCLDLAGVPPPNLDLVWTNKQTETITFPHPSDAGGNYFWVFVHVPSQYQRGFIFSNIKRAVIQHLNGMRKKTPHEYLAQAGLRKMSIWLKLFEER